MPKSSLTDAFVRGLKPLPDRRQEITDTACRGLALRVTPAGVKSWSFKYRDRLTGRTERLSLGRYPDVSLAAARMRADHERGKVAGGANPRRDVRRARTAERSAITFDKLAESYLARVDKQTPRSAATTRSTLNAARQHWAKKRAKDIGRAEIVAFLEMRAKSAPVAANRTLGMLKRLFDWATEEGFIEASPVVRISKPTRERARDRILLDDELAVLLPALDSLGGMMALAFRLLALCGQRPGEVIFMVRDELLDLDKPAEARWELPPERTKNKRRHVVPLAPEALRIVRAALATRPKGDDSPFVFLSERKPGNPFDRQSFARAMKRTIIDLDVTGDQSEWNRRLQESRPTPHDFRRTAITGLSRLGFVREHIKALVNHAESDVTDLHYLRYDYLPEKRRALEAWERHVLTVLDGAPHEGNVVPLRGQP